MAQHLVDSTMSPSEAGHETVTTIIPQWLQRAITRAEGIVAGVAAVSLASHERLVVAIACDSRQAEELRLARLAVSRVLTEPPHSARNFARVALTHFDRADSFDRYRDEHVDLAHQLVRGIRTAASTLGGLLEHLLTGRSRPVATNGGGRD